MENCDKNGFTYIRLQQQHAGRYIQHASLERSVAVTVVVTVAVVIAAIVVVAGAGAAAAAATVILTVVVDAVKGSDRVILLVAAVARSIRTCCRQSCVHDRRRVLRTCLGGRGRSFRLRNGNAGPYNRRFAGARRGCCC